MILPSSGQFDDSKGESKHSRWADNSDSGRAGWLALEMWSMDTASMVIRPLRNIIQLTEASPSYPALDQRRKCKLGATVEETSLLMPKASFISVR